MAITLHPVRTPSDVDAFLRVPWPLYRGDPNWVPPLLYDQKRMFDRTHYPFYQHGEVESWIARRDGTDGPVGRISAILSKAHLELHKDGAGFFGFFESENDPAVAGALFEAAAAWVREKGCTTLRGPTNFTINDTVGTLVEGFDSPAVFLMTYNPPYHPALLEQAGFRKAKDLYAWRVDKTIVKTDRMARLLDRIKAREKITLRPLDFGRFDAEIRVVHDLYHRAWEANWGFVPMSDAEFEYLGRDLRKVADPDLLIVAEAGGKPVGFAASLPDLHVVFRHLDGRLLPFGWLKWLWLRRTIRRLRVLTLGVVPEYRGRGLDAVLYGETIRVGLAKGYTEAEMSWTLEDNPAINKAMENLGGVRYKTYRVYEKKISVA